MPFSDTLVRASSIANSPNATTDHIGISFQGYANCSTFAVIGLSDKSLPGLFLGLAFLSATLPLLLKRYRKELIMPQSIHPEKTISFGNLNLSCEIAYSYLEPLGYLRELMAGKDQRRRDLEHLDPKATAFSGGKQ